MHGQRCTHANHARHFWRWSRIAMRSERASRIENALRFVLVSVCSSLYRTRRDAETNLGRARGEECERQRARAETRRPRAGVHTAPGKNESNVRPGRSTARARELPSGLARRFAVFTSLSALALFFHDSRRSVTVSDTCFLSIGSSIRLLSSLYDENILCVALLTSPCRRAPRSLRWPINENTSHFQC